jgi:hypothetical protein
MWMKINQSIIQIKEKKNLLRTMISKKNDAKNNVKTTMMEKNGMRNKGISMRIETIKKNNQHKKGGHESDDHSNYNPYVNDQRISKDLTQELILQFNHNED